MWILIQIINKSIAVIYVAKSFIIVCFLLQFCGSIKLHLT